MKPKPREKQDRYFDKILHEASLSLPAESQAMLEKLAAVLDETLPLDQRHRLELKHSIRDLWEDLTSEREHRTAEYLSSPRYYQAYIRYFLPWNLVRLSTLFANLDLPLSADSVIIDMGSGPLTIPIALYLARPDLRTVPLHFHVVDKTNRILQLGKLILEAFAVRTQGALPPWTMTAHHQAFGDPLDIKADLFTAANVFNEFFWKSKELLGKRALQTARQILGYVKDSGRIFLFEPGDPRSGSFISAIRAAFIEFDLAPLAPCPHRKACPMPGIFRSLNGPARPDTQEKPIRELPPVNMPKRRDKFPWCHFTIGVDSAPAWLMDISEKAKLPKTKLSFSYLLAQRESPAIAGTPAAKPEARAKTLAVRIVSEPFRLPGYRIGRYACSPLGYALLTRTETDAAKEDFASGKLVSVPRPEQKVFDEKSGAILLS